MKNKISILPIHTDQVLFMREQQVRSQFEEIIKQVNNENIAVVFRGTDQTVVLSPYWWYIPVLGPDPMEALGFLFEASKSENEDMAMKYIGVALGFIRMTTRESAQNILDQYFPQVNSHPYANRWSRVMEKLAGYWDTEHSPELVMAGFAGGRDVCMLFTDNSNRIVNMQSFLGKGLTEEDLRDEAYFQEHLTLGTGALIWEGDSREVRVTFSSRDLLAESVPFEAENPDGLWLVAEEGYKYAGVDHFRIYREEAK